MVKKSKLLAALDAHRGRNHKLEHQKKLQKYAAKRKKVKDSVKSLEDVSDVEEVEREDENTHSVPQADEEVTHQLEDESDGWESDESSEAGPTAIDVDESESDSQGNSDYSQDITFKERGSESVNPVAEKASTNDEESGIPLSDLEDLSENEKADVVPHQRLTINNTKALLKAHNSITLSTPTLPFHEHQSITATEPPAIPDINDDLNRELAFYKQSLDAAKEARALLKKEAIPFSRPNDYFAEMIKTDEHMGKIKQKMTDEAANKKAAAEARKQRDLKKFGKQVQVAKLQERDKAKRETLDKINILKRKRKDADTGNPREDDLFDVALEDAGKAEKPTRSTRNDLGRRGADKRRKKDEKFGYGGKKRFAKSGDAVSTGDLRSFSAKKMKGQRKGPQRLGKSRRAKQS